MRNIEGIKVPIKWLIIMVSLAIYFHSSNKTPRILDYTRHKQQFQSVWLFHSFIDSFKTCATFMHVVRLDWIACVWNDEINSEKVQFVIFNMKKNCLRFYFHVSVHMRARRIDAFSRLFVALTFGVSNRPTSIMFNLEFSTHQLLNSNKIKSHNENEKKQQQQSNAFDLFVHKFADSFCARNCAEPYSFRFLCTY